MNLIDQMKVLYDGELLDDVKTVTSILLTLSEYNSEFLTAATKYQTLVYHADSLLHCHEYKKAEKTYRKALQLKKMINKTKGKTSPGEMPTEAEVKFKLHQCLCQLKNPREAIAVLEGITPKQRNSKTNLSLAKLYQTLGMDRSAVTSFKEVLRECPLSLSAVQGLLTLGIKGTEICSIIMSGLPGMTNLTWLSSWIEGQAQQISRDYSNAIHTYMILDTRPVLRDNNELLLNLGEVQFLNGDYDDAMITFCRAQSLDPHLLRHMDLLAYMYYKSKMYDQVQNLSTRLMLVSEQSPEPWIAMGYYCLMSKRVTRAVYFGQKAYTLDNSNLESLLMKGAALLELKKLKEAITHYREVVRLAPHRYEAHKGLIACHLGNNRTREAIVLARQAYKQLGYNARSCTLYATVLAKEPSSLKDAKALLDKAMKCDPNHLEAVYAMADILKQQHEYDKGIELLRSRLGLFSSCKLHQMLGDFLTHTRDLQEALQHYNMALSIDPNNSKAKEGLERVEKNSDLFMDSSLDIEAEDIEGSDNEADLEGSESGWSDFESMGGRALGP